ncbi:hypothetical protein BGZ83_001024 [Gryganskiella cystojenkinii]|nr:hypothetical protein BGZ83_001024 [Gryganskiella cystojenkinii]
MLSSTSHHGQQQQQQHQHSHLPPHQQQQQHQQHHLPPQHHQGVNGVNSAATHHFPQQQQQQQQQQQHMHQDMHHSHHQPIHHHAHSHHRQDEVSEKMRHRAEQRAKDIAKNQEHITYSARYYDDHFEYRHVSLPKVIARYVPNELMTEEEWRSLGVKQSQGWEHYMIHAPEPHVLLFKREKDYQAKYLNGPKQP